jgi:hypothetical protein
LELKTGIFKPEIPYRKYVTGSDVYLEDREHGKADIIKGCYSIVGTRPFLKAHRLVLSTRRTVFNFDTFLT